MIAAMSIEQNRQTETAKHAALMKERFAKGYLSHWQSLRQWVGWKTETDEEGKEHKVPHNPGNPKRRASIRRPDTWGTLAQALAAYSSGSFALSGIGFVVTPPFVLIDLDHSYNRDERTITKPKASEIIAALDSATEASPHTGIHIYAQGRLPGRNLHTPDIEIYTNWFTTITTDHIEGTPLDIEPRQEQLSILYETHMPPHQDNENTSRGAVLLRVSAAPRLTSLPPEAANDPELQRLLSGDTSREGGDESRADWNLLMKLLHWTGDDVDLTRDIFLASPLGSRKKARKRVGPTDYVSMTIRNIQKRRRNRPMDR